MAMIVWRVTTTFLASACCVISSWKKRYFRISLRTLDFPISEPPAVQVEPCDIANDPRPENREDDQVEHHERRHPDG